MERRARLEKSCDQHRILAVYLFGSRADDGVGILGGTAADRAGSDLDIGIYVGTADLNPDCLADLQVDFEDVFAPLRVDVVPLDRVDALFQFRAIDGRRVFAADTARVDRWELVVMRRAAELLPVQRAIERSILGVTTT